MFNGQPLGQMGAGAQYAATPSTGPMDPYHPVMPQHSGFDVEAFRALANRQARQGWRQEQFGGAGMPGRHQGFWQGGQLGHMLQQIPDQSGWPTGAY